MYSHPPKDRTSSFPTRLDDFYPELRMTIVIPKKIYIIYLSSNLEGKSISVFFGMIFLKNHIHIDIQRFGIAELHRSWPQVISEINWQNPRELLMPMPHGPHVPGDGQSMAGLPGGWVCVFVWEKPGVSTPIFGIYMCIFIYIHIYIYICVYIYKYRHPRIDLDRLIGCVI